MCGALGNSYGRSAMGGDKLRLRWMGGSVMYRLVVGEDEDTAGCCEPHGEDAGDGRHTIRQFMFRNEDMR